jgi:hypothetical protein
MRTVNGQLVFRRSRHKALKPLCALTTSDPVDFK